MAIAINVKPKIASVDSMFIAKLSKDLVVCPVSKVLTPAEVNERCAQDFAGGIGLHILSISPGSVTAN